MKGLKNIKINPLFNSEGFIKFEITQEIFFLIICLNITRKSVKWNQTVEKLI